MARYRRKGRVRSHCGNCAWEYDCPDTWEFAGGDCERWKPDADAEREMDEMEEITGGYEI